MVMVNLDCCRERGLRSEGVCTCERGGSACTTHGHLSCSVLLFVGGQHITQYGHYVRHGAEELLSLSLRFHLDLPSCQSVELLLSLVDARYVLISYSARSMPCE